MSENKNLVIVNQRNQLPMIVEESGLYSYLLPISFLVVSLVLTYFGIDIIVAYLISTGVILLLSLPFVIKFKSRIINKFLDLEVIN